jgi:isoleucyl-tRNA synthetase
MKDEKGQEMHKTKGNAVEFNEAADREGADAMRWLYASHNPEYDLWFGYNKIHEARRQFLTLWNVYEFFTTYARIDEFDPSSAPVPVESRPELDRWILYRLRNLVTSAHRNYSGYSVHYFMRDVLAFIDALSRWYLRRSRRRFWKSRNDDDKLAAYQTLWECLTTTAKLLAPVIPFSTEKMYQELVRYYDPAAPVSVHLCDFPQPAAYAIDEQLLHSMDAVLELVEQGHAARNKAGLKVRQPLAEMQVLAEEKGLPAQIQPFVPLILDELNLKKLGFVESAAGLYSVKVRLDAKSGKPKFGRLFAGLEEILASMSPAEIQTRTDRGESLNLSVQGAPVSVDSGDLIAEKVADEGWEISEGQGFLVAIHTELSTELIREGLVRDLVRHIQNLRKEIGLEVTDRIRVAYSAGDHMAAAVASHGEYLAGETLAVEIRRESGPLAGAHEIKLGQDTIQISLAKA